MKPKFSIIVPFYNAEATLRRCINSILLQSFQDYELILVDDGSKDGSLAICNDYRNDIRVTIEIQNNGGVSKARNKGLQLAKGEWICFIDSDDYIEIDYLKSFNDACKSGGLLVQGYKTHRKNMDSLTSSIDKDSSFSDLYYNLEINNLINSPWAKAFYGPVLRQDRILFNENLSYGEDHLFVLEYLLSARQIFYIDTYQYVYCVENTQSLAHRSLPSEQLNDFQLKLNHTIKKLEGNRLITGAVSKKIRSMRNYELAIKNILDLCMKSNNNSMLTSQLCVIKKWYFSIRYLKLKHAIIVGVLRLFPTKFVSIILNRYIDYLYKSKA